MPRPLRITKAGYLHHVVARGNDRQLLFKDDRDFELYVQFVADARKLYPVKIYNYALMSNHVHFLIEPGEDEAMSKFMEYVTKAYAKTFNTKYDHVGHVFQGRYKSFLVEEKSYFFNCCRYIDLNPVEAGMAKAPGQHKWQGYQYLAAGKPTPIDVDYHDLYLALGRTPQERQIAYRALVMALPDQQMDLLNARAKILGSKEYAKSIRKIFNR